MQPTGAVSRGWGCLLSYIPEGLVAKIAKGILERMEAIVPPMKRCKVDDAAAQSMVLLFATLYILSKEQRRRLS